MKILPVYLVEIKFNLYKYVTKDINGYIARQLKECPSPF
jgi:hypothetical protein